MKYCYDKHKSINIYWVSTLTQALCFLLRCPRSRYSLWTMDRRACSWAYYKERCWLLDEITEPMQFKSSVVSKSSQWNKSMWATVWMCSWGRRRGGQAALRGRPDRLWTLPAGTSCSAARWKDFTFKIKRQRESGKGIVGANAKVADKDQSLNKTCSVEMNQYFIC